MHAHIFQTETLELRK